MNYEDVSSALESGQLGGLGINVFHTEPFIASDPLLNHPNVVATPHVAGVTHISYRTMASMVSENVKLVMAGKSPMFAVNSFA